MSTVIEAVAHYQRDGDGPGHEWMWDRLREAAERGDTLEFDSDQVFGEWSGGWVQVIVFTYQFKVTSTKDGTVPFEVAKALAQNLAESIVGEADVQVLGLTAMAPDPTITPESAPAGARVRDGDQFGEVVEWQGSGIVVVQYDDGTRSIGAVNPGLRVVTEP